MIYRFWLALSLVSLASASWDSSPRMLKHRQILSRAGYGVNDTDPTSTRGSSKKYKISDQYAGSSFFDRWDFFNETDPTNGNVNYLAKSDAISKQLAYVESDGTVVIKVDDTNWVSPGANRDSVRISTSEGYTGGLFVLDVQAMPHGCGVWPAWWTVGPQVCGYLVSVMVDADVDRDQWPNNGEIDIIEGVHDQQFNQMTLHTASGCTLDPTPVKLKSTILSKDCNAAVNYNTGCAFLDTDTASYGAGLNAAGGGVFAMLWADDAISVWFFARCNVPSDLQGLKSKTNGTADPTGWGVPKARWASTACSTSKFFKDHSIVFDTTLCGDWAGATYGSAGCPGTCADRLRDPANFRANMWCGPDAAWRINSVTVFT
ncbi:hypothetical protein FRC10_001410 [Ceratobasidium sp. 414]|nr:hypothetical protein FRC10_001410 [Ceratobasidium sp. 414]